MELSYDPAIPFLSMYLEKTIDVIYIMKDYSVIKKNEIMPLAATSMDPEIIILSEVR